MSDQVAKTEERRRPAGAGLLYVTSVVGTAISADTSWRFFGERLHIVDLERWVMFAALELFLVACGWGTRANVRRGDPPGAPQRVAWLLCGLSAYMAVDVSGPVEGLARVALGPVLALGALHLALGIDIKALGAAQLGTLAKVGRELRERVLSLLGLGDDGRDAAQRTRDRAAARAARLATGSVWFRRDARLAAAVRKSGATVDATQRDLVIGQVAALRSIGDLRTAAYASPWTVVEEPPAPAIEPELVVAQAADQVAAMLADQVARNAEWLQSLGRDVATQVQAAGDQAGQVVETAAGRAAQRIAGAAEHVEAVTRKALDAIEAATEAGRDAIEETARDSRPGQAELDLGGEGQTDDQVVATFAGALRGFLERGELTRYRVEKLCGVQRRQADRIIALVKAEAAS